MKSVVWSTAALSILVVNLNAQQSSAPSNTSAHSTRVVAGCLRAGSAPDSYRLVDATALDPKPLDGQPTGTAGTKTEYDVTADSGLERSGPPIDLKPHLGQQVELTVRPAETAVAPLANSGAPTVAEAKPVERKAERVTVTAIKSLASSCTP